MRRHEFARRHDERVSPLVREIVVLPKHGKLDGAKVLRNLGEREPSDLDEAEERLGREQAVVLVQVAHVPVGRDERQHGVEHLGRPCTSWAPPTRAQSRGLCDPGREEALPAFSRCQLDDGEVRRDFGSDGRDGFGRMGGRW